MGLKDRVRRLQRLAEGDFVSIPQRDGTARRFPESALKDAYLNLMARLGAAEGAQPEHPLLEAARNSSAPEWSGSVYATDGDVTGPIEDLSE